MHVIFVTSITRIDKLDAIRRKAMLVIDRKDPPPSDTISATFQRKVSIKVFKYKNKLGLDYFDSYFFKIYHSYETRRNNSFLEIPNVKLNLE